MYVLKGSPEEELETLQKQQIKVPIELGERSKWCNSFVLIYKTKCKVQLCLDPVRLNKAVIRHVHIGPILTGMLLKLAGIKYLTLINASPGYHNLKLDEKSSYLTFLAQLAGKDI